MNRIGGALSQRIVIMLPIESSCLIGNWMPENSVAKPAGPDEVEEEFMETLRQAAFIFE